MQCWIWFCCLPCLEPVLCSLRHIALISYYVQNLHLTSSLTSALEPVPAEFAAWQTYFPADSRSTRWITKLLWLMMIPRRESGSKSLPLKYKKNVREKWQYLTWDLWRSLFPIFSAFLFFLSRQSIFLCCHIVLDFLDHATGLPLSLFEWTLMNTKAVVRGKLPCRSSNKTKERSPKPWRWFEKDPSFFANLIPPSFFLSMFVGYLLLGICLKVSLSFMR